MSFKLNSQAPAWPYVEHVKDAPNSRWNPQTHPINPVKSDMVLFLDVDGVLIHPGHGFSGCPGVEACTEIAMQTKCDVVISSGWQFNPYKLHSLHIFLETCGFESNQIHSLQDLLGHFYGYELTSKRYSAPPLTLTRSIYIRSVIKALQRENPNVRCMVLDDMHLSSEAFVKMLSEKHLAGLVDDLSGLIFESRTLADNQRDELMNKRAAEGARPPIPVEQGFRQHSEDPPLSCENESEGSCGSFVVEECKTAAVENDWEDACSESDKNSCHECCSECQQVNHGIRVSVAQSLYDPRCPQDKILFGSVNCLYGILNPKVAVDAAMSFVDDVIVKALWQDCFDVLGPDEIFVQFRQEAYSKCWKLLHDFVDDESCLELPAGLPDLKSYFRHVNPRVLVTAADTNAVICGLAGSATLRQWRHPILAKSPSIKSTSPDRKTSG